MVTVNGKLNTCTKYKLYNTDEYRLIMYIKNIEERRIQPFVSADTSQGKLQIKATLTR